MIMMIGVDPVPLSCSTTAVALKANDARSFLAACHLTTHTLHSAGGSHVVGNRFQCGLKEITKDRCVLADVSDFLFNDLLGGLVSKRTEFDFIRPGVNELQENSHTVEAPGRYAHVDDSAGDLPHRNDRKGIRLFMLVENVSIQPSGSRDGVFLLIKKRIG